MTDAKNTTQTPVQQGEVMIHVEDLKKSFGDNHVLNGITQDIRKGEKVVIIGPSGSGKSTFLRCLNLLEVPTSGHIIFEGTDLTDKNTDINAIRRKMGMVFQHFNLFPNMTVRRNITLAPVRTGFMKQEEADAEAERLLARVGLLEEADTRQEALCLDVGFILLHKARAHRRQRDVPADGHVGEEIEVLENHSHLPADRVDIGILVGEVCSFENDVAAGGHFQKVETTQESGFS